MGRLLQLMLALVPSDHLLSAVLLSEKLRHFTTVGFLFNERIQPILHKK
jgi:hypothetical protein